jgi:rhodanese-related sulfurtransferase
LIDVRDMHERLVDSLPLSEHVPLNELIATGVTFPTSSHLVVFCATGSRSPGGRPVGLAAGVPDLIRRLSMSRDMRMPYWRSAARRGHS